MPSVAKCLDLGRRTVVSVTGIPAKYDIIVPIRIERRIEIYQINGGRRDALWHYFEVVTVVKPVPRLIRHNVVACQIQASGGSTPARPATQVLQSLFHVECLSATCP